MSSHIQQIFSLTKQEAQISSLKEQEAFMLFWYHRICYTICVQFAYFMKRFDAIFGLGILFVFLCDIHLPYREENIFTKLINEYHKNHFRKTSKFIPELTALYEEYVIKCLIKCLTNFVYSFVVVEAQGYINNFLIYFDNNFTVLHWKQYSHFHLRHYQIAEDKQICALLSCKIFPKEIVHEIKLARFQCTMELYKTPQAFTMIYRNIIFSLIMYTFLSFEHVYLYPLSKKYLHQNHFILDMRTAKDFMFFCYKLNIAGCVVLIPYLILLLKYRNLI